MRHAFRLAELILRRKALSINEDSIPSNMYIPVPSPLDTVILDRESLDVGRFMLHRFLVAQGMFGLKEEDALDIKDISGSPSFISRAKRSKGVTIKRINKVKKIVPRSQTQAKEEARQTKLVKEAKTRQSQTSFMNTCQAIVSHDCRKLKVSKSLQVPRAIVETLSICLGKELCSFEEQMRLLTSMNLVLTKVESLPDIITHPVKVIPIEFAGVKFHTNSPSHYIKYAQDTVLNSLLWKFPRVKRLIICEEKYHYTPDVFKGPTRAQRTSVSKASIVHLKKAEEAGKVAKFTRKFVTTTAEGKNMIGIYLASNVRKLTLNRDITLDIDSELNVQGCSCKAKLCQCNTFTNPVRCIFNKKQLQSQVILDIKQRKGEGEQAQIDWLIGAKEDLEEGEGVASVLTSGDIDGVVNHIFSVSLLWPRKDDGSFKHPVFVILQKQKFMDVYNITGIIELLEGHFKEPNIAAKVAVILCMGGNDYMLRYQGITHTKIVKEFLKNDAVRHNLLSFDKEPPHVSVAYYKMLVKHLYCPSSLDPTKLSVEDIRQISIKPPGKIIRPTLSWMPPETVLDKMANLLDLQVQYLLTAGDSEALLPDFKSCGIFKETEGGIEYDFGPDSHIDINSAVTCDQDRLKESIEHAKIKQGGRKRKDPPRTPRGPNKKPMTSTPVSRKQRPT